MQSQEHREKPLPKLPEAVFGKNTLRVTHENTGSTLKFDAEGALLDWLRADMGPIDIERVRILYLNSRNMLIRDEAMSEGSVDEAAVYVREIMRRALDCHATALIIVHNHPSGDPQPSQQDIRLTRDMIEAGRHLKITVHDHVIIGRKGHSSLRALGLI